MIHGENTLSGTANTIAPFRWLGGLGLGCWAIGFILDTDRGWANLLLVGVYLLGLGLAGLYFVAIHYAAGAGWATAFRRIPEALMGLIPIGSLLIGLAAVGGGSSLYPWLSEQHGFTGFKGAWLNVEFFYVRSLLYILVFCFFSWVIGRNSRRQDTDPNPGYTQRNRAWSAAFLLFGSIALTLASVDWVKSLEPHWFSTMWGVYQFAGFFVAGLAAIVLIAGWLKQGGREVLSKDHLHDLAKLLFTMSTFWMYIWFSQAMLIWYANVSEEVIHYTDRLRLGWGTLMVALVILLWVVPFFALMSRRAKGNYTIVRRVGAVILVGHLLDLMIQIHPPVTQASPAFAWGEVGALLVILAALFLVVERRLSAQGLVPVGDPHLGESLHYHS